MKETKSETSIPKYAPTMEPIESALRTSSNAKPPPRKHPTHLLPTTHRLMPWT